MSEKMIDIEEINELEPTDWLSIFDDIASGFEPVTIHQDGDDSFHIISDDEYRRLKALAHEV